MNLLTSHTTSSKKVCAVCGKSFESSQTFDFLCSDACKEIYINNGGFLPESTPHPKWALQTSTGFAALYMISLIAPQFSQTTHLSPLTVLAPPAEGSNSIFKTQLSPSEFPQLPDHANPTRYKRELCLSFSQLEWESQTHQDGFRLIHAPDSLLVKTDQQGTYQHPSDENLSPWIKDTQAPIIEDFRTSLLKDTQQLQIHWSVSDPNQTTTLFFEWQEGCGLTAQKTEEIQHASQVEKIELTLDGKTLVLTPDLSSYTYQSLSYGLHRLEFRVYDAAGNVSETKTIQFELIAPVVEEEVVMDPSRNEQTSTIGSANTSNGSSGTTPSTSNQTTPGNASNTSSSSSNSASNSSNSTSNSASNSTSNSSNTSSSTNSSSHSSSGSNSSSSNPTPSVTLPNDTKGNILKRISSRHASISESDYWRILKGAYDITPTFVLQTIENKGFDIVLTGNNIRDIVRAETGWDAGWNYHGVTFPNYQGYMRIWSSLKGGSNILVHEIGHAYDYSVGRPSSSDEFQAIYQAEALKLFPGGGLYADSSGEYYAESFRMYLNERSVVKNKAPQTAAYFKNVFGF